MNKPRNIALVIVAVLVIGGIALTLSNQKKTTTSTAQPTPTPSTTTTSPDASPTQSPEQSQATIISYNGSSFSPADTTVKSGQTVTFKNSSSIPVQVDSDPHPIHTDDTDLNIGSIDPGQSKTITVTKTGSFGFHNHLNPTQKGHITIQ